MFPVEEFAKLSIYAIPFSILGISAVGSTHCISMCGPLCLAFNKSLKTSLQYHIARLLAYLVLVSLVFSVKSYLNDLQLIKNISPYHAYILYGFLIVFSLSVLFENKIKSISLGIFPAAKIGNFLNRYKLLHPLSIGFANGFLPCGWFYGFLFLTPLASSFLQAYLWTVAFWLPNALILSLFALGLRNFPKIPTRKLQRVIAVVILFMSILQLTGKIMKDHKHKHSSSQHNEAVCH